ncbi:MAG: element excision factor XisI family protein [Bacteroidota bacterium]
MDKISKYRGILENYLQYRASLKIANSPDEKAHLVIDREKDEYVLLWVGWSGVSYKHGLMFHFQIVDGKVWIHENRTDIDLVEVLSEAGILSEDIIPGFVEPYLREKSEVAMAG